MWHGHIITLQTVGSFVVALFSIPREIYFEPCDHIIVR